MAYGREVYFNSVKVCVGHGLSFKFALIKTRLLKHFKLKFVYTAKSDFVQNVLSVRYVIFKWIFRDTGWNERGKYDLGKEL